MRREGPLRHGHTGCGNLIGILAFSHLLSEHAELFISLCVKLGIARLLQFIATQQIEIGAVVFVHQVEIFHLAV